MKNKKVKNQPDKDKRKKIEYVKVSIIDSGENNWKAIQYHLKEKYPEQMYDIALNHELYESAKKSKAYVECKKCRWIHPKGKIRVKCYLDGKDRDDFKGIQEKINQYGILAAAVSGRS